MGIAERIELHPEWAQMVAQRDIDALAAALNSEGYAEVRECWLDAPALLKKCESAKSFLRKLRVGMAADPLVEVLWASLVYGRGLDFGADAVREIIDDVQVPISLSNAEVADLKAQAMQPVFVTRDQVYFEMFNGFRA